jgi:hypothetical protein
MTKQLSLQRRSRCLFSRRAGLAVRMAQENSCSCCDKSPGASAHDHDLQRLKLELAVQIGFLAETALMCQRLV